MSGRVLRQWPSSSTDVSQRGDKRHNSKIRSASDVSSSRPADDGSNVTSFELVDLNASNDHSTMTTIVLSSVAMPSSEVPPTRPVTYRSADVDWRLTSAPGIGSVTRSVSSDTPYPRPCLKRTTLSSYCRVACLEYLIDTIVERIQLQLEYLIKPSSRGYAQWSRVRSRRMRS